MTWDFRTFWASGFNWIAAESWNIIFLMTVRWSIGDPSILNPWSNFLGLTAVEALIIRIGIWGPVYYDYNEEPPK